MVHISAGPLLNLMASPTSEAGLAMREDDEILVPLLSPCLCHNFHLFQNSTAGLVLTFWRVLILTQ